MTDSCILEVKDVKKRFGGVRALRGVSLDLREAEVLAVVGENGAGKSTLMKILAGVQTQDSGEIRVAGKRVSIDSCRKAMKLGIVLIHQELNLADNLDVASNIFLGREPGLLGWVNQAKILSESRTYLEMIGLEVDPATLVRELSIGQQQMVEIAKALSTGAKVLIMDEPTSSLSTRETEKLFKVVKDLRSKGVSIIYISHRLGEVEELADRTVVLRDGENAGNLSKEEINRDNLVRLMVGRDLGSQFGEVVAKTSEPLLRVEGLVSPAWPAHALDFTVGKGEIVGVAGLVGAGRTEMLEVLFGIRPALAGTIKLDGKQCKLRCPQDAIQAGIALVPEDRKQHGLIIEMAVGENIGLPGLKRNQWPFGFLNGAKERSDTQAMTDKMRIKTPDRDQFVQFLSGGNQQKVVIGKWLSLEPKLLLLDEPTRGIDVGAKQEIYRLMKQLAADGVAILFVSSELEEILGMSERTLVMHEGCITGELAREELSEEAVMQLATGSVAV